MLFEEAEDMYMMYKISPELTCGCDEVHICQQCWEMEDIPVFNPQKNKPGETDGPLLDIGIDI